MSSGTEVLADQKGRFTKPVPSGTSLGEVDWHAGRILVSRQKLVLANTNDRWSVPFSKFDDLSAVRETPPVMPVSSYLTVKTSGGVFLLAPREQPVVERSIFDAILDGKQVLVKHPAVRGGVVQNADWGTRRLRYEGGQLSFRTGTGESIAVQMDEVGAVDVDTGDVRGKTRLIATVTHTSDESTVETQFAGGSQRMRVLATYCKRGEAQNTTEIDVDDREQSVLVALYSGVSPHDIPEFVDEDVETVEEIYDRLVDAGLLSERRVRREVRLKSQGRVIASEMADET